MPIDREDVLACLKQIVDPSGNNLVSAGLVRGLAVEDDKIRFVMEVADPGPYLGIKAEAEAKLKALGAASVGIVLTAHRPAPPPDLNLGRISAPSGPQKIPGVERIIAIASGKGGVGKSTVAANLACALAAEGRRVGMLDADVYGPSQPRLLGVSGRPSSPDGKTILPMRNFGVTMMSIGLMTNDDQAVVWRGPMLIGALQQMLLQVQWGALDVLIVDLPPGTGDVPMTLAQKAVVDGVVIVSTPQDVALLDARKGVDMFQQLGVPIFGMVENMSTHICSACGYEEHVFGHGGVKAEAAKRDLPLIAEIPLHLDIRRAADGGAPIVVSQPESAQAEAFRSLAKTLIDAGHL